MRTANRTCPSNYVALAVLLAAIAVAVTCGGCSSIAPSSGNAPLLIQPVLDRIVPSDFRGDGEFGERGQYLDLQIRVGGLRKSASGWTWTWLAYRRTVKVPIAPGVAYQQEGWVSLGTPTAKP